MATGANHEDISFQGRGGAYVTIGLGSDPANRSLFGDVGSLFGTLLHMPANGDWRVMADASAHEAAVNPGGGPRRTSTGRCPVRRRPSS